jgi:large subunit ribosomal protein L30
MTHLKVTLLRSQIGCSGPQRATLRGLGLKRIGASRTLENTPSVRGMVKSVLHLVTVEECSAGQSEVSHG